MQFVPGQIVVHPVHGPLEVVALTTRTVKTFQTEYIDLLEPVRNLRVSVPAARADEVGLRPVMSTPDVTAVLAEIAAESVHEETGWSRRMKDYELRLQTRDVFQKAVVVRELLRRSGSHPASTWERSMLRDTTEALVREFTLACGCTADEAHSWIVDAALTRVVAIGELLDQAS